MFGKESLKSFTQGKTCEYLGMTLEFTSGGVVICTTDTQGISVGDVGEASVPAQD